jgi:hypothetical protein
MAPAGSASLYPADGGEATIRVYRTALIGKTANKIFFDLLDERTGMLRRLVPASRRCEAKECLSTCGLSGFEMPNCLRNSAQVMRTPLATMGWSGHRPGKSQSLGLRQRQ